MLNGQQISAKLRRQIDRELEAGEFIKWIEQPLPRFTLQSLGYFLFGIPWTTFAIFLMYLVAGFKIPILHKGILHEGIKSEHLFALFGVPFVLIGLWMVTSPFRERLKASQTVYLITNKRAISIESGWFTTIRKYTPAQLKDLYYKKRQDGTGDVVITTRIYKDTDGYSQIKEIGFMNVRNPREVERLLQQLAQTET